MRAKLLTLSILVFSPALAHACGPASMTDFLVPAAWTAGATALVALVLPLGLVARLWAGIQSWRWAVVMLTVSWFVGTATFTATSLSTVVMGASLQSAGFTALGVQLIAMTATTMGLYRLRSRKIIAARPRE